ncbi:MAG: septal ring lytic transglycosylase RlpA family protein [Alphaproteobacteria bacterium]|nr:septal ring lytic transglycosylase RlpA family protein [Alphaproteobacteria bacterium]
MLYRLPQMAPLVDILVSRRQPLLRSCILLLVVTSMAGCGSHRGGSGGGSTASRGAYKVGNPYTIDGTTYVPREEFNHTETGMASWYGPGFHGRNTANGEVYNQSERTAAHRTLQMPSVVRVTNLDNGRSTTVRINDRGPYARSRILDVSRATAEELGMIGAGTAHIRIDQLSAESMAVKDVAISGGGPAEQEAAIARVESGRGTPPPATAVAQAPPPAPEPSRTVAPPPAPSPPPQQASPPRPAEQLVWATPPAGAPPPRPAGPSGPTIASLSPHTPGGYYVQAGAFSTMTNAERQRGLIASYGATEISQAQSGGREVFRVRLGPYTTSDAAGIVADRLKRSGYGDARVVAD